jgi:hypothetical protein
MINVVSHELRRQNRVVLVTDRPPAVAVAAKVAIVLFVVAVTPAAGVNIAIRPCSMASRPGYSCNTTLAPGTGPHVPAMVLTASSS